MNEDTVAPGQGFGTHPHNDMEIGHQLLEGRHAWLQVLRGSVSLNGVELGTSDGAAISEETRLAIRANPDSEIMLFDLA